MAVVSAMGALQSCVVGVLEKVFKPQQGTVHCAAALRSDGLRTDEDDFEDLHL